MEIFLAKEGIPSALPDEQMKGGPEKRAGRWGWHEGHLAVSWIPGNCESSGSPILPQVRLVFLKTTAPPEMNQRVNANR